MPAPIAQRLSTLPAEIAARRRPLARAPQPGADAAEPSKLRGVCEEMEALFVHHMLSEMRKTVDKSGLIDGGRSEEIYTSLMDVELAREMARSGGLGLATILQGQLSGPAGSLQRSTQKK
jgi:flagellar protein FlgJ